MGKLSMTVKATKKDALWRMLPVLGLAVAHSSFANSVDLSPEAMPLLAELRGDGDNLPVIHEKKSLEECIEIALDNNRKRPASRFSIAIAEAQHRQAMAGFWPQLNLKGMTNLRSEEMNFLMPETHLGIPAINVAVPESTFDIPAMAVTTSPTAITIPAGAFGNPVPLQLPVGAQQVNVPASQLKVPAQNFTVPAQDFRVPEQDITVADRTTYGALLDLKWLILDGGGRRHLRTQAKQAIRAAREDARRTDLEIIHDVKRMFHGASLAARVERIGNDTLERMQTTLEITEQLFEGGSMTVTKTDYLRNKIIVENIRMIVEKLSMNRELAQSALVHAMGLSWKSSVEPKGESIGFKPYTGELGKLIGDAYEGSTDWRKLEIGLTAAEAKVKEAKSEFAPKVAITGNAHYFENGIDTGAATDQNLQAWNIGVGVELPLFRGFLTKNRVDEAKARLALLKEQKVLLREGLALQIKQLYLDLKSMQRQEEISQVAEATATENRDLSERGYRADLIEVNDVFQSQLFESFIQASRLKLQYEHTVSRAKLDLLIGRDLFESDTRKASLASSAK
jgi:outer membrane protein